MNVSGCRFVAVFIALAVIGRGDVHSQKPAGSTPSTNVRFTDISSSAGVDFRHINGASPDKHLVETIGSGGLFFDYDNDGWIDIFLVDGGSLADPAVARQARHRLFRNRGNGTFEDVTASIRHSSSRLRHGRVRRRLRQRRPGRSLRHQRRPQHALPQRRRREPSPTSRVRLASARRCGARAAPSRISTRTAISICSSRNYVSADARAQPLLRQRTD